MDWLCCLRRRRYQQQAYDALREEPRPGRDEYQPAQYISAGLESEYDIENFQLKKTFTSLYKKVSEWSLPKKQKMNLFTVNEEEHDFLMNEPGEDYPEENFDDVVDGKV
ncbi:unnamed protein product [Ectocarpus sp. 12 AP-2014]